VTKKISAIARLSLAATLLVLAFQRSALATPVAPELDPHTIGAGLTLFGGAAALVIERYRRRKR
jgi:hypothetical protein